LRILSVSPYHEPEGGGLERYAHAIDARLARRGHEVRAVAMTATGLASEAREGVAVQRVPATLQVGHTPMARGFRRAVARAIAEQRPDVVVAHTPVPFAAEMASSAARRARVPLVVVGHAGQLRGTGALGAVAWLDRWTLHRAMLARAQALVAVSPYVRDHAFARFAANVVVIPPGVDARRFHLLPAPEGATVLFVGPLDHAYRWKGFEVLLTAFRHVHRALPAARLVLVGDGDRRAALAARAQHEHLPVAFPGRLADGALVQAYQHANVVCLPSTTDAEAFGMVLAEANACGRPVVGSRVGGIPDFVRPHDNGLLAEPGDARGLADALLAVLRDPVQAQAMGWRGRARVLAEHDWDDLAARMEAVLAEAASTKAGAAPVAAPLRVGDAPQLR
jgi:glycosyltransferase involved in cell wall biosynthesis